MENPTVKSGRWLPALAAAALFAGVTGELDAVNSKHVPTDESLCITGHQHLAEQGFDLGAQVGNELGDVGVAGLAVTTERDELDVALTGLLNRSAGDYALAVGQQHNFEHDARVVGAGTYLVVVELRVQRT